MASQAVAITPARLYRLRFESWLTWVAMRYLSRRGYASHVGLCRDWVEMDDLQ